jgi:LuxR family quorum-sensing system transcriptional regulator CciR
MRSLPQNATAHLTHRQLECIVLVARGKSDWEISKILGLSEHTVKDYIKEARERYDVPTRIQVVMRALYDGAIPFSELF